MEKLSDPFPGPAPARPQRVSVDAPGSLRDPGHGRLVGANGGTGPFCPGHGVNIGGIPQRPGLAPGHCNYCGLESGIWEGGGFDPRNNIPSAAAPPGGSKGGGGGAGASWSDVAPKPPAPSSVCSEAPVLGLPSQKTPVPIGSPASGPAAAISGAPGPTGTSSE